MCTAIGLKLRIRGCLWFLLVVAPAGICFLAGAAWFEMLPGAACCVPSLPSGHGAVDHI
jgi:hypothetical protein